MWKLQHLCAAFVPLLSIFKTTSAQVLVYAPERVPSNASQYIDHAFGSFSMAVHVFPDYAGKLATRSHDIWICSLSIPPSGNNTTPNLFSRNLLEILGNKTGKAPYIRVGGTSAYAHHYHGDYQIKTAYHIAAIVQTISKTKRSLS